MLMNCAICLRESATKYCPKCQPKRKLVAEMDNFERELNRKYAQLRATTRHWILNDDGQPVPATLGQWSVMMEDADRRIVKQEWIGDTRVSTIFLGLNHGFGSKIPILWETMTFSNSKKSDGEMMRCGGNREQAEAMHRKMCQRVAKLEKVKLSRE